MSELELSIVILLTFIGGIVIGVLICIDYIKFYHSQMKLNKEIEKGIKIDEYANRRDK